MATEMSLKILVDKNRNKVLFAESGKDFVDFLFSLLSLPVATIVRLLTETQTTTGCIGNLYCSVDNLDQIFMQPNVDKSLILQPKIGSIGNETQMLFMQSDSEDDHGIQMPITQRSEPMKPSYYGCIRRTGIKSYCYSVTNMMGASCVHCGGTMTVPMHFVEGQGSTVATASRSAVGGGEGRGYVKGVMNYMITDDLEVKPMSTISSIAILSKYDVKDVGTLEERVVHWGRKEGLDLLRASLRSKSVLTDVFLKKGIKVIKP